jgi:hypothetical protein
MTRSCYFCTGMRTSPRVDEDPAQHCFIQGDE